MSTTAPRRETARPSAEREAWERYRDSLRDLRGREYEDAERESWQQLQVSPKRGRYLVGVHDRAVRSASVRVGAPRKTAQDQLLRP